MNRIQIMPLPASKLREFVGMTYGSEFAGAMDLRSPNRQSMYCIPGQTYNLGLGFAIAIPNGLSGLLIPRSGLGTKHRFSLANTVGLIDSDYRGELMIVFSVEKELMINHGDRIAQLAIVPTPQFEIELVDELPITSRGMGGFGHTGMQ
jgi:dUTP pyrophosphatase